jgi:predicted dehydrogenase
MEPIDGPIRWGIAGTGGIASSFVADFAKLDDGEIVAVGSRSAESATVFAAERGIERSYGSYDALAADPHIDAVYVAGIHPVHAPHAELFLDAGKHVLVEKPIALNVAQVDEMIAAAERNDRFLMEAMWMRFNPAHVEMMQRIEAGAIGEVRRLAADFSFALPFDGTHRLWDRSKGGGALLDLGIYPFTLAWWTLGPPDRIDATGHVAATGVDDEVALLCSWDGGASASLTAALRLPGTMTARIEGTEGAIDLAAPAHCIDRLTIRRGGEVEEIQAEAGGLHHQVAEVHRCLRAGANESPRMPLATSRAIIERFDRIRAGLGVRYDAD